MTETIETETEAPVESPWKSKNDARKAGRTQGSYRDRKDARLRRRLAGGKFGKARPEVRLDLSLGCGNAHEFVAKALDDRSREQAKADKEAKKQAAVES